MKLIAGNRSLLNPPKFVSVIHGRGADHGPLESSHVDTAGSDNLLDSLAGVDRPDELGGGP